jgi:O-glycosyl hydrolase
MMSFRFPRLRRLFPTLFAVMLGAQIAVRADYTATVEPGTPYQTLEGWGTSLAWWPNVIGGFPDAARADYLNKIFDPVEGLGLNVVRYNIGGGENPKYLPPNKPRGSYMGLREAVPGYEPTPGQWDWNADANQRRVLFESLRLGVNEFEAFSNSPPYWMTNSGSVTGMPDGGDNLDPKYTQAFADYLTTVTRHFHDVWGLTFRTLEPVNEPSGGWWKQGGHQEGCHFSRAAQTDIVKATAASLAAKGMNHTVVSSPDENTIDDAVRTWNQYDGPARAAVGQINTHTYGGTARSALRRIAHTNHKRLWMSEYGDGDATGIHLSERILSDMKVMRPVAWVYWQAVDGGGWGLLVNPLDDTTHTAYTINEKYYVFAQYTRFIRPGDTIIGIDDPQTLAAYNTKAGRLTLVVTNDTDSPTTIDYDLSQFRRLPAVAKTIQTSPTQNLAVLPNIALAGKKFAATLPAQSVTTFVLTGVTGILPTPSAPAGRFDPDAVYSVVNVGNGQALNAGTTALSLTAPDTSAGQQWSLTQTEDGSYEIADTTDGRVLDVNQSSRSVGAAVIQWEENGGHNQEWKIVPASGGTFTLINQNSGLALDIGPNGVVQQTVGPQPTQRWRFVKVTARPKTP